MGVPVMMPTLMSTTSIQPGQTSLQAERISADSSGWLDSNSKGLPAKQTMTALTEEEMMENSTDVSTKPTTSPIL